MMIQKSIVTVLLVTSWLQCFSEVGALDSGITRFVDSSDLSNTAVSGSRSFVDEPLTKRNGDNPDGGDDDPLDSMDKDILNSLKRRSGLGEGIGKFSSGDSSETETSLGSLLALRRRGGLLGRRSHTADDHSESIDGSLDQQSDGGHTSISLLNLRRRGDSNAGKSETSISLIGGLRRRATGLGGLSDTAQAVAGTPNGGTLLGLRRRQTASGVSGPDHLLASSTVSTKRDGVLVVAEQDDDEDIDQVAKIRNVNREKYIDSENDNENDNDNDIDDSDNNDDDGENNQILEKRTAKLSAILPGSMARAHRRLYARDNDEDRRIIEDYENLLKEQQEREKQIREKEDDLLRQYGNHQYYNQQYTGQSYDQQYPPFSRQQYQSFARQPIASRPYQPARQLEKNVGGSRKASFNVRHRMENNRLANKA